MDYSLGLYEKAMPAGLSFEEMLSVTAKCGFDRLEISVDETEESKNDSGKNCSEEEIKRMKNWAGKVVEESHAALA